MSTHGPDLAYVAPGLPLKFSAGRGLKGAMALLKGETAGMAIDFTGNGGLGYAAVKGHTTNLNNVPVDDFLTQSGTSPKLVLGADGLYHWSPHNLLLQSQTFDNATWVKAGTIAANAVAAPDGTLTADRLDEAVGVGAYNVNQTGTVTVAGALYTLAFCFKRTASIRWAYIQLNISASVAASAVYFDITGAGAVGSTEVLIAGLTISGTAIQSLGNGWYRASITFVGGTDANIFAGPCDADGSRFAAGSGSIYVWGAQLNRGTTALAYHVTTTAAWFGVPIEYSGALVEPQATNLILQSQAFETATWGVNASTATANQAIAPDGTLTADLLTATGGAAPQFYQAYVSTPVVETQSVFFKKGTAAYAWITDGAGNFTWFNTTTGAVGTNAVGSTAMSVALPNGWFRFSVSRVMTGTGHSMVIGVSDADNSLAATAGVTGYFWGAQVELGSVATSPIPTFAATVTRATDGLNVATSAFPFSATAGSVIERLTPVPAQPGRFFSISDGTNANRILLYSNVNLYIDAAGVNQMDADGGNFTANTRAAVGAAWAANDAAIVVDGGAPATDASVTLPTVNSLKFAGADLSFVDAVVKVHSLTYVPRRMTNAELQAKTA